MGARARKHSSSKITCSISEAPRPPYSSGHEMPTQPASYIFFCHATRRSNVSRSGATRSSCGSSTRRSVGRFAASHSRISRRKASCSACTESPRVPSSTVLCGATRPRISPRARPKRSTVRGISRPRPSAWTRASATRRKSSPRMRIDTEVLPALNAMSVRSATAAIHERRKPEQRAERRHGAGHAARQREELVRRREPQRARAEERAQPRVVHSTGAGDTTCTARSLVRSTSAFAPASSGVPRTRAASALVSTGACSTTRNRDAGLSQPAREAHGDGGPPGRGPARRLTSHRSALSPSGDIDEAAPSGVRAGECGQRCGWTYMAPPPRSASMRTHGAALWDLR